MFGKKKETPAAFTEVTAGAGRQTGFKLAPHPRMLEEGLYESLRANVPVIDAAISKLVRLTGGFSFKCENEDTARQLEEFFEELPVSVSGSGLSTFTEMYLDSLLTYGRAFGEVLLDEDSGDIAGLYCADCTLYSVRRGSDGRREIYSLLTGEKMNCPHPERILYTAQNPTPKNPCGTSLLRGLPALANILMEIYRTVGENFDRAGNVRYAVTYKPSGEGESAFAKERAMEIARQWADGMTASKAGNIKDFVAVGDVDIKVIGADNQFIATEVPVRQLLEQIVAKLGLPPFLLGLSWSSTERMSSQQSDLLTGELESYRRLLTPVLVKICGLYLRSQGFAPEVAVEWYPISLQDEAEEATARLTRAKAEELEQKLAREAGKEVKE